MLKKAPTRMDGKKSNSPAKINGDINRINSNIEQRKKIKKLLGWAVYFLDNKPEKKPSSAAMIRKPIAPYWR